MYSMRLLNRIYRDDNNNILNLIENIDKDVTDFIQTFSCMGFSAKDIYKAMHGGAQILLDHNIKTIYLPYVKDSDYFLDLLKLIPTEFHFTCTIILIKLPDAKPIGLQEQFNKITGITCELKDHTEYFKKQNNADYHNDNTSTSSNYCR